MNDKLFSRFVVAAAAATVAIAAFVFCFGCYYYFVEPADWAHSEIRNMKPYLYGSQVIRCAYHIFFLYALNMCGKFWFSKSKLIHKAGYTIYFCIISKRLLFAVCLIAFCCCCSNHLFNDLSMISTDLFSISNSKWSDYSLNLDSVEWYNVIFRFACNHLFSDSRRLLTIWPNNSCQIIKDRKWFNSF